MLQKYAGFFSGPNTNHVGQGKGGGFELQLGGDNDNLSSKSENWNNQNYEIKFTPLILTNVCV